MATKARTNLTSLDRLERQLQAITPDRAQGDAWEKALKGWINAGGHPELTKAWMWGEWPGKLKAGLKGDKGVDLVAETRDKQLVAIQVKFRRDPKDPVTAPEVQKLVGSYRKHFALFALASNAWSATRGVSEAVGDEDAMLILREQLLESSYDWAVKKSIKRTRFTPFPFQKVAAENVRKALAKGGRAQIVMACGTGKTVTMLLAAEALDAQRVLVLAPTLLLVKQLRDEWISKRRPDREWASLAVCSDIGDGMDATEIAPAEFGAPPTTNPDEIAAFLKKPGRRVVFGTYASSDRIAKAQKKAGVPSFDLAVADEAHRIAGVVSAKDKSERSQRVMLEEKEIKAVRRLFATATPRITGSKKTRDGEEIFIESMDDESRFGKVAHSVTFQEAVKLKRLVPYKLVVTIVTNDEVADAVQNRRFIDVKGKPYAADEVATAIAIRRAYKELGISKIISYHSRVAGAKAFADLITQVPGRGKSPVTEHVAGSMPVNDRKHVLNRLAAATEPYLVTNARCLTEGIDVPALDAVAFADPRKSQVDIVQAVGRAMRRPMGTSKKTTGYIILPVYLTKKELKDPETAVEGSAFEPVLQVLRALKDHDPFMAKFMAKILVAKGKKPHRKEGGIGEIIEVSIGNELDKVLAKRLLEAVQLRVVDVVSRTFELGLAFYRKYRGEGGDPACSSNFVFEGFPLGMWLASRRHDRVVGRLTSEQTSQLDDLGMYWSLLDEQYEKGRRSLTDFVRVKGHANVPARLIWKGYPLGSWVTMRRSRKEKLSQEQIMELDGLGMIWDAQELSWTANLEALRSFKRREGHVLVVNSHLEKGLALGKWLAKQRTRAAKGTLALDRKQELEKLGVIWSVKEHRWDIGFSMLKRFKKREGHANVPQDHLEAGFPLGNWISEQRVAMSKDYLKPLRKQKLKELGVVFDTDAARWSHAVEQYVKFKKQYGHDEAPRGEQFGGIILASWITNRRTDWKHGRLSEARIKELDKLGFRWTPKADRWDFAVGLLERYIKRTGSSRVPVEHIENGFRLGHWLSKARSDRKARQLDPARIAQLTRLGVEWVVPRGSAARKR